MVSHRSSIAKHAHHKLHKSLNLVLLCCRVQIFPMLHDSTAYLLLEGASFVFQVIQPCVECLGFMLSSDLRSPCRIAISLLALHGFHITFGHANWRMPKSAAHQINFPNPKALHDKEAHVIFSCRWRSEWSADMTFLTLPVVFKWSATNDQDTCG